MSITIYQPSEIISEYQPSVNLKWLQFFDVQKALIDFVHYLDNLPSFNTQERHTHKAYLASLKKFMSWAYTLTEYPAMDNPPMIFPLPDENLLYQFISYLRRDEGLKAKTINQKYLAPIRLFLTKLYRQDINIEELSDADAKFVMRMQTTLRNAKEIPSLKLDESSNRAPVDIHGTRLSKFQASKVLRKIDRQTLAGKRDYALLFLALNTGMRNAELQRMKLSCFTWEDEVRVIKVQRKRSNHDPIPVDEEVYEVIMEYVTAFNEHLESSDPRYITDKNGLWQAIGNDDKPASLNLANYNSEDGISCTSIWNIVGKRTKQALGFKISVHDIRRTLAKLLKKRVAIEVIQRILGHKNLSTTIIYIGSLVDDLNDLIASNHGLVFT